MLSNEALQGYSKYTKNEIDHARYKIGNSYFEAVIDRIEYLEGNQLSVWMVFNPPNGEKVTITEVQLIDTGGKVFLTQAEKLVIDAAQEGAIYNIIFSFKEVEADAAS